MIHHFYFLILYVGIPFLSSLGFLVHLSPFPIL
ncbi:hypothetical protein N499_0196A, partial [Wolbachia pipientis wVitA]